MKLGRKYERCKVTIAKGSASALEGDGADTRHQFEQLTAQALTENDIELRYRRMAATGSAERGLELLEKLDRFAREH